MATWNGLDFFIFLIFAVNTLLGMSRGATREIISAMCLSAGLIFAIKFTVPFANFLGSSPLIAGVVSDPNIQNFMASAGLGPVTVAFIDQVSFCVSLLLCFAGAFCTCEAVMAFTGAAAVFSFPVAMLDRKLGAVLGALRGYIFCLLLLTVLAHLLSTGTIPSDNILATSFFANLFQSATALLDQLLSQQNPANYQQIFQYKDLYKAEDVLKTLAPPR